MVRHSLCDDEAERRAQVEMWRLLRAALADVTDVVERRSYEAEGCMLICRGNDYLWRHPRTGERIAWADRPGLLSQILLHWQAMLREHPDRRFRIDSAMRYILPRRLDPSEAPKSNRPPAESEAGRVLQYRSDDAARVALQRQHDAAVERDQLAIRRWEKEHVEEARALFAQAEEAVEDRGPGRVVLVRAWYQRAVRERIEQATERTA